MDNLVDRIEATKKAYGQWALGIEEMHKVRMHKNTVDSYLFLAYRNSLIKLFEICFDLTWKLSKAFLDEKHGIVAGSPRTVFESLLVAKIINESELKELFFILNDRNMTTHTYNEITAEKISLHIENYYDLMHKIVTTLETKLISS